jgi:hypothetical protein
MIDNDFILLFFAALANNLGSQLNPRCEKNRQDFSFLPKASSKKKNGKLVKSTGSRLRKNTKHVRRSRTQSGRVRNGLSSSSSA